MTEPAPERSEADAEEPLVDPTFTTGAVLNEEDTAMRTCPSCQHPGSYGPTGGGLPFPTCPECGWPGGRS